MCATYGVLNAERSIQSDPDTNTHQHMSIQTRGPSVLIDPKNLDYDHHLEYGRLVALTRHCWIYDVS